MLPIENIETLNKRLEEHYGRTNDQPNYRIVWSEDQYEMRLTEYTDSGMQLIHPEFRNLPKYKQWIQQKYVLERLTEVPIINQHEMSSTLSYEPLWVFETPNGDSIRPAWAACKLIVEQVNHNIKEKGMYTKYKDPYADKEVSIEKREKDIRDMEEALFGNETPVGDALAYRYGVGFTTSNLKTSKKEN